MTESVFSAYLNLEAEQSVLGAALLDASAAELAAEMVQDDFSYPAHKIIHQAIRRMVNEHVPIDLVTMHKALMESNQMDLSGGPGYLTQLINKTPTVANVKTYITIVRECSSRRRLRAIGQELLDASADGLRTVDEIREQTALSIRDVLSGESNLVTLSESIVETYDLMGSKESISRAVPTGISEIDRCIGGGLLGSLLMVIGARPSVGKSILALTICLNAARSGKRVLFSTLEMDREEIDQRIFAREASVSLSEIVSRNIALDSWQLLADALPRISGLPLTYTTEAYTIEDLRRDAFRMYEDGGLDLICVDYLQLMHGSQRHYGTRQEEVADISRGLKQLARELKVPIIALSQLSRLEKSNGKRQIPTMSDARESGAIEQDANIFILLHDPKYDELSSEYEKDLYKSLEEAGKTLILAIIDKNRQGRKAILWMAFDGDHMRILPVEHRKSETYP